MLDWTICLLLFTNDTSNIIRRGRGEGGHSGITDVPSPEWGLLIQLIQKRGPSISAETINNGGGSRVALELD